MAQYIEKDALEKRLQDFSKWCKDGRKQGVDFVLDCVLTDMKPADVAPKSEVVFAEIEQQIKVMIGEDSDSLSSFKESEELCDSLLCDFLQGRISSLQVLANFIDKLKKKYTEVEQ